MHNRQAYDNDFNSQLAQFPMLIAEPWRVNELIEEEAIVQRLRLCSLISWVRIAVVVAGLLYLFIASDHDGKHKVVVASAVSYVIFVFAIWRQTRKNPEQIYLYSFFVGMLEIALLGYLSYLVSDEVPISFLYFSVTLSAMLMPLWSVLFACIVAALIICVKWLGISLDVLESLLSADVDWGQLTDIILASESGRLLVVMISGLFGIAIIVNRLANWSFRNDVKAKFRYRQMRQVLSFNRAVIEHLRSGVVVVSGNGKILSINHRAVSLLNIQGTQAITELSTLSKELDRRFRTWLSSGVEKQEPYKHNDNAEEVFLSFDSFGEQVQRNIVMLTLESVNETLQQTQDAKLAALGRLTAGVAHEIRNPLASINSASQLLAETTEELTHRNLAKVILKNVKRTDQIISDILGLFKDTKAEQELLSVQKTLDDYAEEFLETHRNESFELTVKTKETQDLFFYFDIGQLEQILWNLLQNSMKYAGVDNLKLIIRYSLTESRKSLQIDVIDNGCGVPTEQISQMFEPFFTGGKGSGLGLYLVRELCSANGANIAYLPIKKRLESKKAGVKTERTVGACFRITTKVYFSKKLKSKIAK